MNFLNPAFLSVRKKLENPSLPPPRQQSRANDFQPIIENGDTYRPACKPVVPVAKGIDQRFP